MPRIIFALRFATSFRVTDKNAMAKGINQKSKKNNNNPVVICIPSAIPDIISSITPGVIKYNTIEADIATARKIHRYNFSPVQVMLKFIRSFPIQFSHMRISFLSFGFIKLSKENTRAILLFTSGAYKIAFSLIKIFFVEFVFQRWKTKSILL